MGISLFYATIFVFFRAGLGQEVGDFAGFFEGVLEKVRVEDGVLLVRSWWNAWFLWGEDVMLRGD
jgi:hypothetical protein